MKTKTLDIIKQTYPAVKTAFTIVAFIAGLVFLHTSQAETQIYTLTPYTPKICPPIPPAKECPPVQQCPEIPACPDQQPAPPPPETTPPVVTPAPVPPTQTPPTQPTIKTKFFKINFENLTGTQPVTFGQPFKKGDIPAGYTLQGVQLDKKATFSDGSLRFGVISFTANTKTKTFDVVANSTDNPPETVDRLSNLDIKINANGKTITIDTQKPTGKWLSGPIVNEWTYKKPIDNDLVANVNIRKYTGSDNARIDIVIENSYTFQANPRNITYDTEITINGTSKYKKTALKHYHHAKWRKTFWTVKAPTVHIKHDIDYLLSTKAVPNYDKSAIPSESTLAANHNKWKNSNRGPMGISIVTSVMGKAGGRQDIGPLPGWSATYLLSQDKRAKEIMLSIGDLSGSYPIHYMDKKTGQPVSIETYPEVSLYWTVSTTSKDPLPGCNNCKVPFSWDTAHQPSMTFLPYLVTGDKYYLDELKYWANANLLKLPGMFRDFEKGLFHRNQVRGMAWSLRTLAQTAAFTTDSSTKHYFTRILNNNINTFNKILMQDPNNTLSVAVSGYGMPYNGHRAISTWMDDFFTWSTGYMVQLDFQQAKPLFDWKSKFILARMDTPNTCWNLASYYGINVRDLKDAFAFKYNPTDKQPNYKLYTDYQTAYRETVPASIRNTKCGSQEMVNAFKTLKTSNRDKIFWPKAMIGWADSVYGNPAMMQPALALAVENIGGQKGKDIWTKFQSRSKKPNYSHSPMWAIVPSFAQ